VLAEDLRYGGRFVELCLIERLATVAGDGVDVRAMPEQDLGYGFLIAVSGGVKRRPAVVLASALGIDVGAC
jgi:hypothetical protein